MTKEIPLRNKAGDIIAYAIVDNADYEWLNRWTWCKSFYNYVVRHAPRSEGHKMISMHRLIMNAPKGQLVDHKDLNPLNNTRNNLRMATYMEQNQNQGPHRFKNNTSSYKGVSRHGKQWQARIRINHVPTCLGTFSSEIDAAHAYDEAARIHHGDFARTNF